MNSISLTSSITLWSREVALYLKKQLWSWTFYLFFTWPAVAHDTAVNSPRHSTLMRHGCISSNPKCSLETMEQGVCVKPKVLSSASPSFRSDGKLNFKRNLCMAEKCLQSKNSSAYFHKYKSIETQTASCCSKMQIDFPGLASTNSPALLVCAKFFVGNLVWAPGFSPHDTTLDVGTHQANIKPQGFRQHASAVDIGYMVLWIRFHKWFSWKIFEAKCPWEHIYSQ